MLVTGHCSLVAATSSRSSEPVLRGAWLDRCRLLCGVGSKSVGTALQDLALARRYYEMLGSKAGLPEAPGIASLKKPVSATLKAD